MSFSKKLLALSVAVSSSAMAWDIAPGDPLYKHQWNIKNTGQSAFSDYGGTPGADLNVEPVHQMGVHGVGVTINVVDDGIDFTHPDLRDRQTPGSKDFTIGEIGTAKEDFHGTAVAGIAAATGFNGIGVRGVAPRAMMRSFNILSGAFDHDKHDWFEAELAGLSTSGTSSDARVINKSYGYSDNWLEFPEAMIEFEDAVHGDGYHNALHGRGALYMTAAGNSYGDVFNWARDEVYFGIVNTESGVQNEGLPVVDTSIDYTAASFYSTMVSATDANDELAYYSTVGSAVLFAAPGGEPPQGPGHVTTDGVGCDAGLDTIDEPAIIPGDSDCQYTHVMNGTSSAAPNASGVAALLMSANPALSARDIRHIMLTTARKNDPEHSGVPLTFEQADGQVVTYQALPGWQTNAAGYEFSNYYGFGILDAKAALDVVLQTNSILPQLKISPWQDVAAAITVPDATLAGATTSVIVESPLTVEAVQLKMDLNHERPMDLAIELISPAGTRSVLQSPLVGLVGVDADGIFTGKRMTSHQFYGEDAAGTWQLVVRDVSGKIHTAEVLTFEPFEFTTRDITNNSVDGIVENVQLRIYGH